MRYCVATFGELLVQAENDPEAAAVLLDALLEHPLAWRDERVLMLCLGVPLEARPPVHLGMQGRRNWHAQRHQSIAFAKRQWELYASRNDFARATIAVLLFGDWRTRGTSGGPPWPMAKRADPAYQRLLESRRQQRAATERFRAAREVRDNALRAVRRSQTGSTGT